MAFLTNHPRRTLCFIVLFGLLFRAYGITEHWKNKDHYNYGGVSSRSFLFCLMQTPLKTSKGLPHRGCPEEFDLKFSPVNEERSTTFASSPDAPQPPSKIDYYRNHPPLFLYGTWALIKVFGDQDWVYRAFTLIFSTLNILLIYLIGKAIWPDSLRPLFAAFFQAFFLGTIYFGTHSDFLTEFNVTFLLISTLAALHRNLKTSLLFALVGGLSAWTNFLMFPVLLLYAWIVGEGFLLVFGGGMIAGFFAIVTVGWLQSTWNLVGFVNDHIIHPPYLKKQEGSPFLIVSFFKTFIASHARMLSPLFALLAFSELFFGGSRKIWRIGANYRNKIRASKESHYLLAILLTGGTGLLTSILGYKYVMVHIFWFILWMPMFALLCSQALFRRLSELGAWPAVQSKISANVPLNAEPNFSFRGLVFVGLLFTVLYPYGVYQGSRIHDVVNSLIFIGSVVWYLFYCKKTTGFAVLGVVTLVAVTNFSQVINYRNEPDSEYNFCRSAFLQYTKDPRRIFTKEIRSMTKDFLYCRGIPIEYEN